MKIKRKLAWKNQKCNECGKSVYKTLHKKNIVYFCYFNSTSSFKTIKICENCFGEIFSEEVKKKVK